MLYCIACVEGNMSIQRHVIMTNVTRTVSVSECTFICIYSAVYIGIILGAHYILHISRIRVSIQQLYALPTLYLCVLYLSENKQRLVSLTA